LSNILEIVKLSAIDLLPAAVPRSTRPRAEIAAGIPKPVRLLRKKDLRTNGGSAGISLHDCKHLKHKVWRRKGIVIQQEGIFAVAIQGV
jgi:hypothetical protein